MASDKRSSQGLLSVQKTLAGELFRVPSQALVDVIVGLVSVSSSPPTLSDLPVLATVAPPLAGHLLGLLSSFALADQVVEGWRGLTWVPASADRRFQSKPRLPCF